MKTGWIYLYDKKRNPNTCGEEKCCVSCQIRIRIRVGGTEELVIELIDYTIQDSTQAKKLHHRLPDNIKPLTEHVLSYGRIWDCFWQRCGACACPGLVELKRKTMIIQVFQEAVQHFSCLFLVFSNAKVLLGFATVRTVEDKVSINTPLNFGTRPQCGIVRETSASIRALPQ